MTNSEVTNYQIFKREGGFALPSIIFLITILTMVAGSALSIVYLRKQISLREIARVKASYAAESGIVRLLHQYGDSLADETQVADFSEDDGSQSHVNIGRWGALEIVRSMGSYQNMTIERTALAAQIPPPELDKALVFANSSHQLVFTGASRIVGDIVVGQPGTSIGELKNYPSPIVVPVKGSIDRRKIPELPAFNPNPIKKEIEHYLDLLAERGKRGSESNRVMDSSANGSNNYNIGRVQDSTDYIYFSQNTILKDTISRRGKPLHILVNGTATLSKSIRLSGLVVVIASHMITVEQGAEIDETILFSQDSVELESGAQVTCQIIAPSIRFDANSVAGYPSILYSCCCGLSDTTRQRITIGPHAKVEGTVALFSPRSIPQTSDNLILISLGATVTGAVYSTGGVTLDGSVIGIVMTRDFYFYDPPTTYLGWLRSADIERNLLSPEFLLLPEFGNQRIYAILDWI